jgi:GTP-binding protein
VFTIAIIGRPNVGKSTLFNRLVGKRLALVDDTPGVTRDRREGQGQLGSLSFKVIDTAGLEDADENSIEQRMRRQTELALESADLTLMLIDARAGVTPLDEHFARWLRRRQAKVCLLANKCEGRAGATGFAECYRLGLGEPLPISAAHGEGMDLLYDAVREAIEEAGADIHDTADIDGENPELQLAVVGRPNAGKSTLINRLLEDDRLITGPEPGLTRDAIGVPWEWRGRPLRLIDTAGLRRKSRVSEKLEKLAAGDAMHAIQYAQVVVLLVDARAPLERQDLTIARRVVDEGRALLIAANKWDLIEDRQAAYRRLRDRLETSLTQVRGLPIVTLSALTGQGVEKLMPAVFALYDVWQARVSTAQLNRWLDELLRHHPPPLGKNRRRIRLRYITQAKTRPPTFVLFSNLPDDLPDSYVRYLQNGLRDAFGLDGTPLRVLLRKQENPYAGRARGRSRKG